MEPKIHPSKTILPSIEKSQSEKESWSTKYENWDDFTPISHPDDKRAQIYQNAGKIDTLGLVQIGRGTKLPKVTEKQKKAVKSLFEKKRKSGTGSYSWIDYLHFLRHQQCRDKHGKRIFGKAVKLVPNDSTCLIPSMTKVVFIGSKFRETLETTGFLHSMQEHLLETKIERRDRQYFCHDYDIRVVFEITRRAELEQVKKATRYYFQNKIALERSGGVFSKELRYHMYPVPEADDLDTEWILVAKLGVDYLCSEDRIQGKIEGLDNPLPRIVLEGTKQEVYQGIIDSDLGIQRIHNAEKADYYAWIRMIVNRSFGKSHRLEDRELVGKLLKRTIQSKQLPQKFLKSLKGLSDHKFATYLNAFISLKAHGVYDEYVLGVMWSNWEYALKDAVFENPHIATMWQWLHEKHLSFNEFIVVMQMTAFLKANEKDLSVTVRKDQGVPVFHWDFGNQVTILVPIITVDVLIAFEKLVSDRKIPLGEIFRITHQVNLDQFFGKFSECIGINGEQIRLLGLKLFEKEDTNEIGLVLLNLSRLLDPSITFGPVENAPVILQKSERFKIVQKYLNDIFNEGIRIHQQEGVLDQYVVHRMASPHAKLKSWAQIEWASWDQEKKEEILPQIIKKLRQSAPEGALNLILQTVRQMEPQKAVKYLQNQSTRFQKFEREFIDEALTIIRKNNLDFEDRFVNQLIKKLEKRSDYLSDKNFEYLVRMCSSHFMRFIKIHRSRGSKIGFFEKYPELRDVCIEQFNHKKKYDRKNIQFLLDHPDFILPCREYCRAAFEFSPKQWINATKDQKNHDLHDLTRSFLFESDDKKAWESYIAHLRATEDVKGLLEIMSCIEKNPKLHPLLATLEITLLTFIHEGKIKDYEEIKQVSERALIGKHTRRLLNVWKAAYPKILKALFDHDQKVMFHYWKRSYQHVGVVKETLGVLATCYQEGRYEELETFLFDSFSQLSQEDRRKIVPPSLVGRIQKHNRDGALKICQIAKDILGEKTESLIFFLNHDFFEKAAQLFNDESSESELWIQYVKQLVAQEKYFEALAMIIEKNDFFQDCKSLEQWLLKMVSDEKIRESDSALWDLYLVCTNSGIDSPCLTRAILESSVVETDYQRNGQHIHQFLFDTLVHEMFVEERERDVALLSIAMKLLSATNSDHIMTLLGNDWVLKSMYKQSYLSLYLDCVFNQLKRVKFGRQESVVSELFRVNDLFDGTLLLEYSIRLIEHSLEFNGTREKGLRVVKWRLETHPFEKHEIGLIISKLLAVDNLSMPALEALLHVSSLLFVSVGSQGVVVSVIEGVDYVQLFTRMSQAYCQFGIREEENKDRRLFSWNLIFPKDIGYWPWFWIFLTPALCALKCDQEKFIDEASLFLFRSVKHQEGEVFQMFIEQVLTSDSYHPVHWQIFSQVLRKIAVESSDLARQIMKYFTLVSADYSKWRNRMLFPVKYSIFLSTYRSTVVQLSHTKDKDQFADETGVIERHFYCDEEFIMQSAYIQTVLIQKKKFESYIKSGLVVDMEVLDQATNFIDERLEGYMTDYFLAFSKQASTISTSDKTNFWEWTKRNFEEILHLYSFCYNDIVSEFLSARGVYEESMSLMSLNWRCSMLEVLFNSISGFLIFEKYVEKYIIHLDVLEDIFITRQEDEIKWKFSMMILKLVLELVCDEADYDVSQQYLSKKVFGWLEEMIEEHKRNASSPSESQMMTLIGFLDVMQSSFIQDKGNSMSTLDLGKALSVEWAFEVQCEQKKYFDQMKSMVPSSWNQYIVDLLKSENEDVPLEMRLYCFKFLESDPNFGKYYADLRKVLMDKLNSESGKAVEANLSRINNVFSQSVLLVDKHRSKRSVAKITESFEEQLNLNILVTRQYGLRLQRQIQTCLKRGLNLGLNAGWVSSQPYQLMAQQVNREIRREGVKLSESSFELLMSAIAFVWSLKGKLAVRMHLSIINYMDHVLKSMTLDMIMETKFIIAILNLSFTHEHKTITDKYYHLLYLLLQNALSADVENSRCKKESSYFRSILLELTNYGVHLAVLDMYKPDIVSEARSRVSNFVRTAFAAFLIRDFIEKKDEILDVLGQCSDENLQRLVHYMPALTKSS